MAEIVNAYGSLAWQALGAHPSAAEITKASVDLRGIGPVVAEIVNICGSQACQALGARSSGDHAGLGECSPGRAEEWAQGSEICQPVDQWLHRPMGRGLMYSTSCSFSKSWHRESFH
jgi:hypothetical protein